MGLIEFIRGHILHVLPILIAGGFAIAIILERVRALYKIYPIRSGVGFLEQIRELVMRNEIAEAVSLCDKYDAKPVARVIKKGLLRSHQPESLIENGLELAVEDEHIRVARRTSFLAMIANVATLLGLLGTIAGLVVAFAALGSTDAATKTTALASGISQAMYATMFGLGVAIPCMVAFSILMNRTNQLISETETAAVWILDVLKQRFFEAEKDVLDRAGLAGTVGKAAKSRGIA